MVVHILDQMQATIVIRGPNRAFICVLKTDQIKVKYANLNLVNYPAVMKFGPQVEYAALLCSWPNL